VVHVALFEPEIPPNTGNIIRLCANSGDQLHLVKPLQFVMDDRRLRRAGLDYHEWASVQLHDSLEDLVESLPAHRCFAVSTKGTCSYAEVQYRDSDLLLFGPETRGLPDRILNSTPPDRVIRIPMRPNNRSLNLSNAVAIVVYEAWRQRGFCGSDARD
jgi:tRNA (cytidine/uridine-2'-O-)-methyltransferase|tara:strand:+ start:1093 stop:1566 length:474 start_codon:yes stop_codon:yes gene_type:complete